MTQVEFRVGVADPLGYACALLRSAHAKGARLRVRVDDAQLEALDERLWAFSALDFLPHCRVGDALQARTPIVLGAADARVGDDVRDCLINLATAPAQGWQAWPRVIEIVGADADAKAAARQRFRAYREAGCAPTTMEVES
jgi:DNA polymerase-3 subunit chi